MSETSPHSPHIELYTDGACSGNPGPGGWAYILKHPETGKIEECSGSELETTNNRMEIMAVIHGLESLKKPCHVELYSDSQYVIYGLNEWLDQWKKKNWMRAGRKPVKNVELWQNLDVLRQKHHLECHWVRGHNNHPENERCDQLATEAIKKFTR